MTEGDTLRCLDGIHSVVVTKIFSNQSIIIESKDKLIQFTRLLDLNEAMYRGIPFGTWLYDFYA